MGNGLEATSMRNMSFCLKLEIFWRRSDASEFVSGSNQESQLAQFSVCVAGWLTFQEIKRRSGPFYFHFCLQQQLSEFWFCRTEVFTGQRACWWQQMTDRVWVPCQQVDRWCFTDRVLFLHLSGDSQTWGPKSQTQLGHSAQLDAGASSTASRFVPASHTSAALRRCVEQFHTNNFIPTFIPELGKTDCFHSTLIYLTLK